MRVCILFEWFSDAEAYKDYIIRKDEKSTEWGLLNMHLSKLYKLLCPERKFFIHHVLWTQQFNSCIIWAVPATSTKRLTLCTLSQKSKSVLTLKWLEIWTHTSQIYFGPNLLQMFRASLWTLSLRIHFYGHCAHFILSETYTYSTTIFIF